eukprot:3601189-Amphidinium_carterae.1
MSSNASLILCSYSFVPLNRCGTSRFSRRISLSSACRRRNAVDVHVHVLLVLVVLRVGDRFYVIIQ